MTPGLLVRLALGDFKDRARRYSFLVMMVAMVYAAYLFLPPRGAAYVTIDLSGYRGIYNSAWIGANVAVMASLFLSLCGFYLVKNAIERDRRSGVGEILAATRLGRAPYLLSKALSNLMVFGALLAVLLATTFVMQLVRGEESRLVPGPLVAPTLLLTLPSLALVAGLAVFFEAWPPLAGAGGNILWFFFFIFAFINPVALGYMLDRGIAPPAWVDPTGMGVAVAQMIQGVKAAVPGFVPDNISVGASSGHQLQQTFVWDGMTWSAAVISGRLLWLGVALVVTVLAVPFFNRFDPAGRVAGRFRKKSRKAGGVGPGVPDSEIQAPVMAVTASPADPGLRHVELPAVTMSRDRLNLLPMVRGELALMVKGCSRWWALVLAGLIVAGIAVPGTAAMKVWVFPWIWMLPVWSSLGCRDRIHGTEHLLFSSPRPLSRQLPATWLAGVAAAVVAGLPMLVRLTSAGDGAGLPAVAAGIAFVPSLALAAGAWSGTRRLFEVIYLLLWYIGPMEQVPALDFIGVTAGARQSAAPAVFGGLAAGLAGLAGLARRRQARG